MATTWSTIVEGRRRWLDLLSAINTCLPTDNNPMPSSTDPLQLKTAIMHRNQMLVTNLDSQQMDNVATWFAAVKPLYQKIEGEPGRLPWASRRQARRRAVQRPEVAKAPPDAG